MFAQALPPDLSETKSTLDRIIDGIFNGESLLVFGLTMLVAFFLGNVFSYILRKTSKSVGKMADASSDLTTVNRLRRIETWIILSIAVFRSMLFILAVYFWWVLTHPNGSGTNAVLGAGALAAVLLGGVFTPLLRDLAFGAGMMAEHWFGVGDMISIEFPKVQGVVERITLRSTKIRGLNGEVIWVANQTISGVRVAQKGVRPTAIDLFVNDPEAAKKMVSRATHLLPGGLSLLVTPLQIIDITQREEDIWHVTAVGETAPGREWILETAAINVFKQLDEKAKKQILIVDPVHRFADPDSERLFARAIKNARKTRKQFRYRELLPLQRSREQPMVSKTSTKTSRKTQPKK